MTKNLGGTKGGTTRNRLNGTSEDPRQMVNPVDGDAQRATLTGVDYLMLTPRATEHLRNDLGWEAQRFRFPSSLYEWRQQQQHSSRRNRQPDADDAHSSVNTSNTDNNDGSTESEQTPQHVQPEAATPIYLNVRSRHTPNIYDALLLEILLEQPKPQGLLPERIAEFPRLVCSESNYGPADSHLRHCTICLSDMVEGETVVVTPCGHRYHEQCAVSMLVNDKRCANCRHDCSCNV